VAADSAAGGVRPGNVAARLQDGGAGGPVGLGGPGGHGHRQTRPPEENPAGHQKSQRHSRRQKTIAWLPASGELRRRKNHMHNTHHTHSLCHSILTPHLHMTCREKKSSRQNSTFFYLPPIGPSAKLSARNLPECANFGSLGFISHSHTSSLFLTQAASPMIHVPVLQLV